MKRRLLLAICAAAALGPGTALPSRAQAAGIKRVGVLTLFARDHPMAESWLKIIAEVLRQRGWEEGRNLLFDAHVVTNASERQAAAMQLVDARVDAIIADHDSAVIAAMQATRSIPIVMLAGQAVELGFAQSLARPGGNVTGVVFQSQEENGRVIGLLRDIRPGLARIGIPVLRSNRVWNSWFESIEAAARPAGVQVLALPATLSPAEIAPMLDAAAREQAQALVMPILPFLNAAVWQQITAWAVEHKVVTRGALPSRGEAVLAFGANVADLLRMQYQQLDRVLRGADPALTPIMQPTLWDTVVNQRLARAVGWPVPRAVLLQATEVIE